MTVLGHFSLGIMILKNYTRMSKMFELINKNKAVIQVLHQNKTLQPLLEHGNISFAKNGYVNLLIENDNAEVMAKQVIEKIRKSFVVVG